MNKREVWIDYTKSFACILVVLGHFFQSMVASNIIPETDLCRWFNQTIYYFHVPLFFICSGYLYQKGSNVNSFKAWKINVLKKLLGLGIPYVTFSTITWLLKSIFSSEVNNQLGGLIQTLLREPTAPYWYLYVLFFMFLIIPTFSSEKIIYIGLIVSIVFRLCVGFIHMNIYLFEKLGENLVWFFIGMYITELSIDRLKKIKRGYCLATVFLLLSVVVFKLEYEYAVVKFILGVLACVATLIIMISAFEGSIQCKFLDYLSKYTMSIYLMHTIFAAGFRSVLFKVGVTNIGIHFAVGVIISFVGPIIAAEVMKKFKWMEFLLYPGKYIKIKV